MITEWIQEVVSTLGHIELWVGGALCSVLLLIGANQLSIRFRKDRRIRDRALTGLVLLGVGLFFLLVGPSMVVAPEVAPFPMAWLQSEVASLTIGGAVRVYAIGLGVALLARIPLVKEALPSCLYACVLEALAMLSGFVYITTGGTGPYVPGPLVFIGLAGGSLLFTYLVQKVLGFFLEKTVPVSREPWIWILLSPLIVLVAVAPYAAWLRLGRL